MRVLIAVLLIATLRGPAAAGDDPRQALAATGKALFEQRCGLCHADAADKPSMAPPLHNVLGRKAGSAEGYVYTPRITLLDIVWTEQSLWTWIQSTTFDTPLISMRHVGVKDPASADALIA
jgi:cytochrome c